jgi:nicotinate-nucleotide pyrophosphorylase
LEPLTKQADAPGTRVVIAEGPARGLLTAERVALNFVSRIGVGFDAVLLDNMSLDDLERAVAMISGSAVSEAGRVTPGIAQLLPTPASS